MKTFRKTLRENKGIRKIIILSLAILVFLIAIQFPVFAKVKESLQFHLTTTGNTLGNFYNRVFTKEDSLRAQLNRAEEISQSLAIKTSYVKQLERDIAELRELLNYTQDATTKNIAAHIITHDTDGRTFLIDKGSDDGVRKNLGVIAKDGFLIGYVEEVNRFASRVILLSNPSASVPAAILGEQETVGLVEGQDGFLLKMDYIPQYETINENDVVVTSGLGGNLPANLVIGVVQTVEKNETAPFQQAFIEPLIDIRSFVNVMVVDPSQEL